jgi:pimeloyl-ACP methyl ester carboxylesterase
MERLELADGRTLEYLVGGAPDALPLVVHNGTPSAAVLFEPIVASAVRHGMKVVAYSRAGYGGSSPRPGRSVADVAGDIAELLDALGDEEFVTVGWSGGGPHALASAALLPGRCLAAATLAGVAPYEADGLDWLDGMGEENIEEFGAAVAGEEPLTRFLTAQLPALADVQAAEVAAALGGLVSEVDRRALTDDFAAYTAAMFRASVATGIAGWRDDDLAFVRPWGFDLASITPPVSVWQGAEDRMVPYAHGRWLAAHLPGAAVHLEPAEGHLSLVVTAFDAVVAELAANSGR